MGNEHHVDTRLVHSEKGELAPTYYLLSSAGIATTLVAGIIFAFTDWNDFRWFMAAVLVLTLLLAFVTAYIRLIHIPHMHARAEKQYRHAEAQALLMVPYGSERQVVINRQFNLEVWDHSEDRNVYKYDAAESAEQQKALPPPAIVQPSMDYIISQCRENSLQVCLGVSRASGEPFIINLVDGTHYRIVGGSGFGKSCEAAAILDQVTTTNDPEHLMIALLDLEHKTSKLFENLPHVADLHVGKRQVPMVATSADEVAQYFRYLHTELDRRKLLSEYDLKRERFLLIYVEEFLSLRREVSEDLKAQMMADFSILALRGRKYGLYLLACAQVDYADKSLRDAMNQFNVNMSFSLKPTAARAIGFMSNDLLKQNFEARERGQFVLETTGASDILLAPQFDVRAKLLQLERHTTSFTDRSQTVQAPFTDRSSTILNGIQNGNERTIDGRSAEIAALRSMGWGKQAIIEKVWQCKKGGSPRYKRAEAEYEQIVAQLNAEED